MERFRKAANLEALIIFRFLLEQRPRSFSSSTLTVHESKQSKSTCGDAGGDSMGKRLRAIRHETGHIRMPAMGLFATKLATGHECAPVTRVGTPFRQCSQDLRSPRWYRSD